MRTAKDREIERLDKMDLCADLERTAADVKRMTQRKRDSLRIEYRLPNEQELIRAIVKEIEVPKMRQAKCPSMKEIAGGVIQTAKRNARGTCEVCGTEERLTPHHIIPRDEGGLDEPENIAILCRRCHDEVEMAGYRTRGEIHRHTPEREINIKSEPTQPAHSQTDNERQEAKKEAAKAEKARAAIAEEFELSAWASRWECMFDKTVPFIGAGKPEPIRPEKDWYAWVYGGERNPLLTGNRRN